MNETKGEKMKTDEILNLINDKAFLDKIYHFSYNRCNTAFEAEDLCSNIIIKIISSVHKHNKIENFYAFAWTIARRVYADFCENRNKLSQIESIENTKSLFIKENEIDSLIEKTHQTEQINKIFNEIVFLSKAYRDVMIMYYIDEIKIKDIAISLNISETTVKQRLFSARNTVRKEVQSMNNRNLSLKPIQLAAMGIGNPCGNDPRTKADRTFSQNLIYLCKDKPKTAKELSEELCVPMPFIEEELEIQCHGENGEYGMLRKLDNGKYISNIIIADYDEYDEANKIYEKYLVDICKKLKAALNKNKEKILSFPYLSSQTDIRFILWSLISLIVHNFEYKINESISNKYFYGITSPKREYTLAAVAFKPTDNPRFEFYGQDGIEASSVGGYKSVFISNIYGTRINKHFHCGHNISNDEKLLMVLRAIGGLSTDQLSETEKEIAAKAIECGYLRKTKNILEPKIIVMDKKDSDKFYNFSLELNEGMEDIIDKIAEELSDFMKKHIPKHLINEYLAYNPLISGIRILSDLIEECINENLLYIPDNNLNAEGVLMIVEK